MESYSALLFPFFFKIPEFLSPVQPVSIIESYTGVVDMVEEDSSCSWCGANISGTDTNCPKCGKLIATRLVKKSYSRVVKKLEVKKKDYSGVYQQQGRMITDADWTESPRITKTREKITAVSCASCGAPNNATSSQCNNCGASL